MKLVIEFTGREAADLLEWLKLRSDGSYAKRIADLIAEKVETV